MGVGGGGGAAPLNGLGGGANASREVLGMPSCGGWPVGPGSLLASPKARHPTQLPIGSCRARGTRSPLSSGHGASVCTHNQRGVCVCVCVCGWIAVWLIGVWLDRGVVDRRMVDRGVVG